MNTILYPRKLPLAICRLCFVTLTLHVAAPVEAEVYRWVDSEGKTHYGDRAPQEQRAKAERVTIKAGPEGVDPDAERNRQQMRAIDEGRQRERAFAEQKAAESRQQQADLARRCKALQHDIREDRDTAVFFRYDDKGNRVLWSAEERLAYREKMQALQQTYCADFPE